MSEYRICSRCIMDTSDPNIVFDDKGVCSHCLNFDNNVKKNWFPNEEGKKRLNAIVEVIKSKSINREYDAIIGLSGGVDSSYLAYIAKKQLGLRLLAVHVDAGWNSEIAVKNIEHIVKKLGIELYTYVVDWDEIKDLQLAFLKSGIVNQDIPQDHAFIAGVYKVADKMNIKYMLSGGNIATEAILPTAWVDSNIDLRLIKYISKTFGKVKLKTYPMITMFDYYLYYPYIKRIRSIRPLNYMPYNKKDAMNVLQNELGWRYYGGKHYESRFTKFYQSYFLPTKFGYDKRRAHLSSLIVTDQISRQEALKEIAQPLYNEQELQDDIQFIVKKVGISTEEFNKILNLHNRTFNDYPSNAKLLRFKNHIKALLKNK